MRQSYTEYVARKQSELGERFDVSKLAPQFVPYYESGQRIEVRSSWGTRRGRVGVTTGWRPAFLLMARRNCIGSSDVLNARDVVVRVVAP